MLAEVRPVVPGVRTSAVPKLARGDAPSAAVPDKADRRHQGDRLAATHTCVMDSIKPALKLAS